MIPVASTQHYRFLICPSSAVAHRTKLVPTRTRQGLQRTGEAEGDYARSLVNCTFYVGLDVDIFAIIISRVHDGVLCLAKIALVCEFSRS
jgi:hypothetical protein